MKMFVGGEWIDAAQRIEVVAPYDGEVIDTVPHADAQIAEAALAAAAKGAKEMAKTPAHQRAKIISRCADLVDKHRREIAELIAREVGKPISESTATTARLAEALRLSAFEGAQIRGETLPLDSNPNTGFDKFGFTWRVPCGVVAAIAPFNFPLYLSAMKVGPALAAGNSVILKPATATPLACLRFTELLLEAGLPPLAIQTITGPGGELGNILCADRRVRKVSFTGSSQVGEAIARAAGVKKISLELGANSPMVLLPDADVARAAKAAAVAGYANAGQVCISLQRVIACKEVYADFIDALTPLVNQIKIGAPLAEDTRLAAMITPAEARRAARWVAEAKSEGATIAAGGEVQGPTLAPTVVADAAPQMRIAREELFAPAVAVMPAQSAAEAAAMAGDSAYGLSAGIFTENIDAALAFAREAESGVVHINWTPLWRADLMPYGGMKMSGVGREGPRYAVEEMTEIKTVVIHAKT